MNDKEVRKLIIETVRQTVPLVLAGRPITKKNRGKPARFYAYQFFKA